MSYLVLARKWRPQTFEEVVGQAHVTRTLQNAIASSRVAHSYLFTGPRGVGKTSTARILAKALNCAEGPTPKPCGVCDSCREVAGTGSVDVIEIDGASNNSVEDIRNLRERVQYSGARDRHKIYIIDEVHMLSNSAFNALLKTLEEPPPHVIFIFATTEVHKVPATILSRTQRFDFRRIGSRDLVAQMKKILDAEGVASSPEALSLVARAAAGSMRDAQTLLDQVISYSGSKAVTVEDLLQVLGGVQESQALSVLASALKGDVEPAFEWVRQLYERGADLRMALDMLQELLRGLLLVKAAPKSTDPGELLPESVEILRAMAPGVGLSRLLGLLNAAGEAEGHLRNSSNTRLSLELFLVRLGAAQPQGTLGELFDELGALEKRLASAPAQPGVPSAPVAPVASPVPSTPQPISDVTPREAGVPQLPVEEIAEVAPQQELSLEALKASWGAVVEEATAHSMLLGASVRDAEMAGLANGQLVLRTRNMMQKETLEAPENLRRLEAILLARFGVPLKPKALYSPPAAPQKTSLLSKPGSGKPSPEEAEKLLNEMPAARWIQENFGAEITEINKF
ncbi:MAG: DNA polymerase III subunit gamma/tau [candidate division FCPU426 bacterium]